MPSKERTWKDRLQPNAFTVVLWVIFAAYLILLAHTSLTRILRFSPDSLVYVDVARNVAAGNGVARSTFEPNGQQDTGEELPVPMTRWAPLHPIAVAMTSVFGIHAPAAALLVPAASAAAILLLAYGLLRKIAGAHSAWIGAAFLLLYFPLYRTSTTAWSENLAIVFMLASFLVLSKSAVAKLSLPALFFAGVFAGLAFATRYALAPLSVFLAVWALAAKRSWKAPAVLLAGAATIFLPVIARNLYHAGEPFGSHRLPSTVLFTENASAAARALFLQFLPPGMLSPRMQGLVLALVIAAILIKPRRRREAEDDVAANPPSTRWLLPAWSAFYVVFLVVYRSIGEFDYLDERLIAPAGVAFFLFIVSEAARAMRPPSRAAAMVALGLAALAFFNLYDTRRWSLPDDFDRWIAKSKRLTWIQNNVTRDDLVVADIGKDIPFFFPYQHVYSIVPMPFGDEYVEFDAIREYADRHGHRYDSIYIVISKGGLFASVESVRERYGRDIAELYAGNVAAFPGVTPIVDLDDARVYRLDLQPNSAPEWDAPSAL